MPPCEEAGSQARESAPPSRRQPRCSVCPYGATARCEGLDAYPDLPPAAEGAIGCRSPGRQAFFYENLHRRDVDGKGREVLPPGRLPAFIPLLVRVLPRATRLDPSILYGVSYTSVILEGGTVRHKTAESLRRELALGPEAGLCLIGTGKDARLERAWAQSERHDLWRRLASLPFELVTTTTFSVWERQPRFDQIYNQERNLYSYDRLTALGMPTVPFVFFRSGTDLRALRDWLQSRPKIDLVAVLAQFYRRSDDFERLIEGMHQLQSFLGRRLRFLVVGCATRQKVERLFSEFSTATIASSKPVMKAIRGRATTADLTHEKADPSIPRHRLLVQNIGRFIERCEALRPLSSLPA